MWQDLDDLIAKAVPDAIRLRKIPTFDKPLSEWQYHIIGVLIKCTHTLYHTHFATSTHTHAHTRTTT